MMPAEFSFWGVGRSRAVGTVLGQEHREPCDGHDALHDDHGRRRLHDVYITRGAGCASELSGICLSCEVDHCSTMPR
jgi:hypothetical protein